MTVRNWIRLRYGPRRWVYLPYPLILSGLVLLGFADDQTATGLWPYFLLISVFVIQLVLPTFAGWIAALAGWLGLWLIALVIAIVLDHYGAPELLLIAALASASSAPLLIFRPRLNDHVPTTIKSE